MKILIGINNGRGAQGVSGKMGGGGTFILDTKVKLPEPPSLGNWRRKVEVLNQIDCNPLRSYTHVRRQSNSFSVGNCARKVSEVPSSARVSDGSVACSVNTKASLFCYVIDHDHPLLTPRGKARLLKPSGRAVRPAHRANRTQL